MTTKPFLTPDITSAAFKADPFPFCDYLRNEAPVSPVFLSTKRTAWLISRYDDATATLKDERFVKNPQNVRREPGEKVPSAFWYPAFVKPLTQNMLDQDGSNHERLRGLVHKAFTPRLVEHMRERVQAIANDLIDATVKNGEIDVMRDFALPLPVTVIAEILGIPIQDRTRFVRWSNSFLSITSPAEGILALPSIYMFMRYLRKLFALRRREPQDDLMSALVQAEQSGDKLTEDELLAMGVLLLTAGYETTVNLIGNGTLALLQNPDQLALLRAQPELAKSAVEELLRYTSPVFVATERFASEDLVVAGTTIPRGALTYIMLGAANRDENQFTNANILDITRQNNRHLAFGNGMHFCVGAPLARIEGQIAFNTLLARLPNLRLAVEPAQLRWRKSINLRGLAALPVRS